MTLFGKALLDELNDKKGKKIPVGYNDKAMLKDIEIADKSIDIHFENEAGQTIHKRLWIPDMASTKAWDKMTVQETYEAKVRSASHHLIDLAKNMIPVEVIERIDAPDLKSLAMAIKTAVMPVRKTSLLNLKVISTSDGKWPEISNFPGYLEKYEEGKKSTLTFKPSELKAMHQIGADSDNSEAADTSSLV